MEPLPKKKHVSRHFLRFVYFNVFAFTTASGVDGSLVGHGWPVFSEFLSSTGNTEGNATRGFGAFRIPSGGRARLGESRTSWQRVDHATSCKPVSELLFPRFSCGCVRVFVCGGHVFSFRGSGFPFCLDFRGQVFPSIPSEVPWQRWQIYHPPQIGDVDPLRRGKDGDVTWVVWRPGIPGFLKGG